MGAEVEKLTQRHGDTEVQKRLATKRHKIHKVIGEGKPQITQILPEIPADAAQQRTLFYSKELYGYKTWIELPIDVTPLEYANKKDSGHGGMDYAMLDVFFKAVRTGGPSPISLRDGLRMTLPGIYAAESARKGGELIRIVYPWS